MTYIFTAHYMTTSGNQGSARMEIADDEADSVTAAMQLGIKRVKADKRRKYAGKLDADCVRASSPKTETEPEPAQTRFLYDQLSDDAKERAFYDFQDELENACHAPRSSGVHEYLTGVLQCADIADIFEENGYVFTREGTFIDASGRVD